MLIVEDGTMPKGANTYASLEEADAYLVPRGLWEVTGIAVDTDAGTEIPDAATITKKSVALIRASDWLNTLEWRGTKADPRRVLAWPRKEWVENLAMMEHGTQNPVLIIPEQVKRACMEMAALILAGTNPLASVERGGRIQSKTESSIGPIGSESTTWFADAPNETMYTAVYGLIAEFLEVVPGKTRKAHFVEVGRG